MNYKYIYVVIGIIIVVIGIILSYQPESNKQEHVKNLSLQMSCSSGSDPLEVGFFLNDPYNIYRLKTWYWGDGTQENNTVNVNNHRYALQNKSETSHTFSGNVTEWTNLGKPYGYANFTINLIKPKKMIMLSGFDQFEAVIIKNDYVGFSTSVNSTSPKFTWDWNDNSTNSGPQFFNPSHKYKEVSRYNGTLSVQDPNGIDTKKFCVLVLSDLETRTGAINIRNWESNQEQFHINHPLQFTTQWSVGNKAPPPESFYNSTSEWIFGDNRPWEYCQRDHYYSNCHTYIRDGNYNVTYHGIDKYDHPVILSKTVKILPLPSIHLELLQNGTNVVVNGYNFTSSIQVIVSFDGTNPSITSNTDENGTFSTILPVQEQSGQHYILVRSSQCSGNNDSYCTDLVNATLNFKP